MFTLPDKLPHDDQLPALEYVFHLATLIEPFEDFYGSPLLERYISRYNTSATKSGLKKLDKLKARLNEFLSREEFGETLTFFELDIEKFWHLLLFVYDFSYNQCTDGIKHISSLTTLQTIIDKITEIQNFTRCNLPLSKKRQRSHSALERRNIPLRIVLPYFVYVQGLKKMLTPLTIGTGKT